MTALTPLLAPEGAYDPGASHQRAEARSNMFVMAVLYVDGGSAPVRIRNMSRGGALIESDSIPPEGLHVRLSRGSLSVRGHIAWRRDSRAGIRFDTAIDVADWLPRGAKPTGQQRVDEMVHACRASSRSGEGTPAARLTVRQAEAIRQLLYCRDSLNAVAEALAGDEAIAIGHPTALQKLDVTAQLLDKLASRLAGTI